MGWCGFICNMHQENIWLTPLSFALCIEAFQWRAFIFHAIPFPSGDGVSWKFTSVTSPIPSQGRLACCLWNECCRDNPTWPSWWRRYARVRSADECPLGWREFYTGRRLTGCVCSLWSINGKTWRMKFVLRTKASTDWTWLTILSERLWIPFCWAKVFSFWKAPCTASLQAGLNFSKSWKSKNASILL